MKTNLKQGMLSGLFEGFFVVLAAALALGANRWNENESSRERGEAAVQAVVTELEANRSALEEAFSYHQAGLGKIRSGRESGTAITLNDFPKGFISPAPVLRVAWDAALQTGAFERLELDAILLLGAVYAEQDDYRQQAKMAGTLIYDEIFHNGTQSMVDNSKHLDSLLMSFWYTEQRLVKMYSATLDEVQSLQRRGQLVR